MCLVLFIWQRDGRYLLMSAISARGGAAGLRPACQVLAAFSRSKYQFIGDSFEMSR